MPSLSRLDWYKSIMIIMFNSHQLLFIEYRSPSHCVKWLYNCMLHVCRADHLARIHAPLTFKIVTFYCLLWLPSSLIFSFLPLRSSVHYFLFFFIRLFISRPDPLSLSSLLIFLCYSPFLSITLNHSLVSRPRSWPWIWKLSTIHPINLAAVWAAKKPEGALTLLTAHSS